MRNKSAFLIRLSIVSLFLLMLSAFIGIGIGKGQSPIAPPTPASQKTATPSPGIIQSVVNRTPEPTATPSAIDRAVRQFSDQRGLTGRQFLGISAEQWINMIISALMILITYLVSGLLFRLILSLIARSSKIPLDEQHVNDFANILSWILVIAVFHFAIRRLSFLNAGAQLFLNDLTFMLYLIGFVILIWRVIDFGIDWYVDSVSQRVDIHRKSGIVITVRRSIHIVLIGIAIIVLLGHFDLNVTGLAALYGVIGLAFSLAAQDTLADAINGYLILIDRPFRIGDMIEIQDLKLSGEVVKIGTRSTRVRASNNSVMIIPNSKIGKSQVVNYTYPEERFAMSIEVSIAYGTDIEKARLLILETVQSVEGVLADPAPNVTYQRMDPSAMIFRVVWWVRSYREMYPFYNLVNTALQNALDAAGIEMPHQTYTINLQNNP